MLDNFFCSQFANLIYWILWIWEVYRSKTWCSARQCEFAKVCRTNPASKRPSLWCKKHEVNSSGYFRIERWVQATTIRRLLSSQVTLLVPCRNSPSLRWSSNMWEHTLVEYKIHNVVWKWKRPRMRSTWNARLFQINRWLFFWRFGLLWIHQAKRDQPTKTILKSMFLKTPYRL